MRRDWYGILLTLAFCLPAVVSEFAVGDDSAPAELEVEHALTFEFPTPHTDWARPYAGGKVRVLFFAGSGPYGAGLSPRECVEVMQRFDIEAEAVFWTNIPDTLTFQWDGGVNGERRMLDLLEKKWDAFVFMGLDMKNMSPEQQYKLLKSVADGAGIVFVGTDDKRVLKDQNRLKAAPPFLAAGSAGEAFTVGKGRGVRLPQRPYIAYGEGWNVEDDYWHERVGRALLWAAGKEPKARLELSVTKPQFAWAEKGQALQVRLSGPLAGQKPVLHLSVRRPGDAPFVFPEKEIAAAAPPVEAALARLPAGSYHADARVVSSAGVEVWATVPFQVTSARAIAQVDLAKDWGEIGERLAGSVALQGAPLPEEVVRVCLLDRRRRELARQDLAAGAKPEFSFEIASWLPMLVTVEARLLSGQDEVSRAYKYFHVTKRGRGRFNFLMWGVPRGTLAPYAEESLARNSVTLELGGGNPPLEVAAFDISWVPYTTRILSSKKTQEGLMQPFCWNDDEAVNKELAKLCDLHKSARQHGVFVYSLGDENDTLGCCLSPHCAQAYREFLKESYGELEALNKSWGTAFKTWDEVGLAKPDDNEEAESLKQKNYPRWFDRQAFKSWNYVRYCGKYVKAYKALDPQARTGFEGAGSFAGSWANSDGDDLDLIVRNITFWSPYPGTADEVVRSIAPRDFPRSNWMGYTKDADSLLEKYWRMVTLGTDAVWWWMWSGIGRFHGWLAPDLRPYPAVKEVLADTQIVRDGLGDLLLQSEMLDDGIAILYSHPSVFAHRLEAGATYGGYENAHAAFHQVVRDLGLQFRYVTDRMLRLGEFDAQKYKVLLLPRAEALGDKEAEAIRGFVRGGGTVIADVRPGLYDGHCKPRAKGVLDELFGVERGAAAAAQTAKVTIAGRVIDNCGLDSSVKLKDGAARGQSEDGAPALIVRKEGQGKAILLNFCQKGPVRIADWMSKTTVELNQNMTALLGGIFEEAGVKPALQLADEAGAPVRNVEAVRWKDGGTELLALFSQGPGHETRVVNVQLPAGVPRHVYDLRHRKSLGRIERFTTTLIANRASFFVLCAAGAPAPRFALDQPALDRGSVGKATLSVPNAEGLHAFCIRAQAGGAGLDWLAQNVIVGQEPKSIALPVAWNDPVGDYEISAIDLFTEEATKVVLQVR